MTVHGIADEYFEWYPGTTYDDSAAFKCFDVITSIEISRPSDDTQSQGCNQLEMSAPQPGPCTHVIRLGVEYHSLDFFRLLIYASGTTTKRVVGEEPISIMGEIKKGGEYYTFGTAYVVSASADCSLTGPVTGTVEIHATTLDNAATSSLDLGSHAPQVTTKPYSYGSSIYLEKASTPKAMRSCSINMTATAQESHAFNSAGTEGPTGFAFGGWETTLSVVVEHDGITNWDLAEAATADTLVVHMDASDSFTFSNCAFRNPVNGSDNGIAVTTMDCLHSGVAIAATGFDS
jgi:hypothetical protein